MTENSRSLTDKIILLCCVVFFLALAIMAYRGFFVRYLADDYGYASIDRSKGIIGSQIHWYKTWVLRYAAVFTVSLLERGGGMRIVGLMPGLTIIAWCLILVWAYCAFFKFKNWKIHWPSIVLLAESSLLILLQSSPDIMQSFYWQAGRIAYTLPLVFFSIYIGIIFTECASRKKQPSNISLFTAGLSTFIAGGFSDTYTLMQFVLLAGAVFLKLKTRSLNNKLLLNVLYAGFLGASIAFTIVLLQPGNFKRLVQYPLPTHPVIPFIYFISFVLYFFEIQIIMNGFSMFSLFFITFFIMRNADLRSGIKRESEVTRFTLLNKKFFLLFLMPILSTIGLSVMAITIPPPGRALIVPYFIMVAAAIYTGYNLTALIGQSNNILASFLERIISGKKGLMIVTCIFLIIPIYVLASTISQANDFRAYAGAWDKRHAYILKEKREGNLDVMVPALGHTFGLEDIDEDSKFYINKAMSRYYGLRSIKAIK